MLTRRRFLLTLPAAAALPTMTLSAAAAEAQSEAQSNLVYFGTDTSIGVAKGIYLSRFDYKTGHLTPPTLVAKTVRPTYLAISAGRRIYATNEALDATASVSSYQMDPATGALHPINKVTATAPAPCYVSLDATGQVAYIADYDGSAIASYHVLPNGALSQPVEHIDYKNPKFGHLGPVADRQDAPHPHSVHLAPGGRFLLVNDLGCDAITVFPVLPDAHLGTPALVACRRGSGPRHIAFHPNGRWVYSINELDSTLDRFLWKATPTSTSAQGLLVNTGHFVKTIAPGFSGINTAAEVFLSPDGRFLYASNRGEDSLVVFTIAPTDGALTLLQRIPCGGKTPRHFTLSPDAQARWILCGNQESATVTVFRREPATGRLTGPIQSLPLDSVMFTLFA